MGLRSLVSFGLHRLRQLGRLSFYLALLLIALYFVSITYYSLYCSYRFHRALIDAEHRHLWNVSHGVYEQFTPILIPVCDRPQYLARVLQGLAKVEGINEVGIHGWLFPSTLNEMLMLSESHHRFSRLRTSHDHFTTSICSISSSHSNSSTYTTLLLSTSNLQQ